MKAAKKRKIYLYMLWPVLVISFTLMAFFVVLLANGYRLNQNTWRLERTSTIVLGGPSTGGKVNLDGIDKGSLPISLRMLSVGRHEVIVTKDKYQAWIKVFNVLAGKAVVVDNLTLFYQNPVITEVSNPDKVSANIKNNFTMQGKNLEIKSDEIYFQEKLVTRFSQPVLGAIYDLSINHIFVQVGNEIRAINANDLNEFTLIKLQKNDPTTFSVSNQTLYYFDGGVLYQAQIR